jgi:TRAP-type C4-dicarboxylate transport system permease small subunit
MRYPSFLNKFNRKIGILSGGLILAIGILQVFEVVMRSLFTPTDWSMDFSQYTLIWAIFLGSAYSFQEKGHVSVDLLKEGAARVFGIHAVKVMAIVGYLLALLVIGVLIWSSIDMFIDAYQLGKITIAMIEIPLTVLLAAMTIGSVLMAVTVVFILLDIMGGGKTFR